MSEIPDKSINSGHNFRLAQITKIKEFFEQEIENRRKLLKKYKQSYEVINDVVHFLTAAEVVSGSITSQFGRSNYCSSRNCLRKCYSCHGSYLVWSIFWKEKHNQEDF